MIHLPIVFIHKQNSDYLPNAIIQAKASNVETPIWLIGTKETAHFGNYINHININRFMGADCQQLANAYKHHSTNGHDYELFCLQRWFILLNFMQAENLDQCLYLDSDLMFYGSADDAANLLDGAKLSVLYKSPHTNFVLSRQALAQFCNFVINGYTGPMSDTILSMYLTEHYAEHGKVGGISDMTFWLYFRLANPDLVADLSKVRPDGSLFDITIDTSMGMVMSEDGSHKLIDWQQNMPYATSESTGQKVLFRTLHFQGKSKALMPAYRRLWGVVEANELHRLQRQYNYQRIINKLKSLVGLR